MLNHEQTSSADMMEAHGHPTMTFKVTLWCSIKRRKEQSYSTIDQHSNQDTCVLYQRHWNILSGRVLLGSWVQNSLWSITKRTESILHSFISENTVYCDLSNVITWKSVCTCSKRDGHSKRAWAIHQISIWVEPPKNLAKRRVFDLENAPINNKNCSEQLFNATGHVLVFSARRLPEINQTELIFGIWKSGWWNGWNNKNHFRGQKQSSPSRFLLQFPILVHS